MRLGFAVFRRRGGAVFHFASEFDGFGPIPVISPRLRRILEQPSGNPPEKPETQTHFGPPGGTAARWRASPRSQWRWRGQGRRRGPSPSEAQARCGLPTWEPPCVSKSVRARGRRGSLETQPLLSPRFRPSSLLGALPSLVSHTRAGIRKHHAAHNGGIKPLCATTCCVNPALVCVTGSSGQKGDRTRMTINWWAAPHEERPTGPQNQVLVSRTDWGGGRPARGGGAVPDPGRTSRAGPQPAGRQARPISPRPSA